MEMDPYIKVTAHVNFPKMPKVIFEIKVARELWSEMAHNEQVAFVDSYVKSRLAVCYDVDENPKPNW